MPEKSRIAAKLEEAKGAVEGLFSDASVSQQETLDAMEELCSDVEGKIDALRSDLKRTRHE